MGTSPLFWLPGDAFLWFLNGSSMLIIFLIKPHRNQGNALLSINQNFQYDGIKCVISWSPLVMWLRRRYVINSETSCAYLICYRTVIVKRVLWHNESKHRKGSGRKAWVMKNCFALDCEILWDFTLFKFLWFS